MLGYASDDAFDAGRTIVSANIAYGPFALPAATRLPINASRSVHFIVLQESPLASNERVIMYDCISEPVHDVAVMAAYLTRAPSISDFVVLAQVRMWRSVFMLSLRADQRITGCGLAVEAIRIRRIHARLPERQRCGLGAFPSSTSIRHLVVLLVSCDT